LDSTGSGQGPVAGCCECGDEPSGSCATELVSKVGVSYAYSLNRKKMNSVRYITVNIYEIKCSQNIFIILRDYKNEQIQPPHYALPLSTLWK
jgi:hypothetical protein